MGISFAVYGSKIWKVASSRPIFHPTLPFMFLQFIFSNVYITVNWIFECQKYPSRGVLRKMCCQTYIHTYVHTYIHTYIHTYLHTYIHFFISFLLVFRHILFALSQCDIYKKGRGLLLRKLFK